MNSSTQILEIAGLSDNQAKIANDALFNSKTYCMTSNDVYTGNVIYTNESGGQLQIGFVNGEYKAILNIPNNPNIPGFGPEGGIILDNVSYPLPLNLYSDYWLFDDLSGKGYPQYFTIDLHGSKLPCQNLHDALEIFPSDVA